MAVVVFGAFVVRGMSGFGAGMIAVPLLAFAIPLQLAVPLCSLLAIAGCAAQPPLRGTGDLGPRRGIDHSEGPAGPRGHVASTDEMHAGKGPGQGEAIRRRGFGGGVGSVEHGFPPPVTRHYKR